MKTETTVSEYLYGAILEHDQIETFLNALTRLTVHELSDPGEDMFCGITLLRNKRAGTVASSSEDAQALDEVQYDYADGPCLTAARTQTMVKVDDLADDGRWPEYTKEVAHYGVRSVLAVPFQLEIGDSAALNLYSTEQGKFTPEAIELAQNHAQEASQAFAVALRLARHRDAETDVMEAMKSRTTIDVAVGIVMGQNGCSQEEAFNILRSASSSRNIKLREIAVSVIGSTGNEPPSTHFDR